MRTPSHLIPSALIIAFVTVSSTMTQPRLVAAEKIGYPPTERIEHYDEYHGQRVHDPYRWLEDDVRESEPVASWVDAQNEVTFKYLNEIPERERIEQRLTALWNYARASTPAKVGGRYFFFRNDGLQEQSVLYVSDAPTGEARVLIDPNTWSDDGTVALGDWAPSPDGKYLAYAINEAGSDWQLWRVMEIESDAILDDTIEWTKFSSAAWTRDSKGFYYAGYDAPEPGAEYQSVNLNQKLYLHRVGTGQADDALIYARPDQPEWGFWPAVTEDGRFLVIHAVVGTDSRYRVFYRELLEPNRPIVELIDNFDHEYSLVSSNGPVLYFQTNNEAPRRRLIGIDTRNPGPEHWREIIPEADDTLTWVSLVGDQLIAQYLQDAKSAVRLYSENGGFLREIDFPGIGSAGGFGGERVDRETFFSFSSYATPPSIYRYDLTTHQSELIWRANVDFDGDAFAVEQVFVTSRDGTRVPMFLTHKKGLVRDGTNPTLLYGYGGFDISITPGFSVSRIAWLEMGGVLAEANLRGGGEYGEAWHKAGTKLQKQNVFDDFIAAAEWLIDSGITRKEKLAVQGGSNGGLLVGAVITQRPELFQAALPDVGVMDMLRFQKFTSGRFWTDDYGSSDDPEEFRALLAYSPYHNLKAGVVYPATLVTTADTDDRVVPGHSFKFAAQLQHVQAGDAPVLIRIETRAGHGGDAPTSKRIELAAHEWAFLVKNLEMALP